MTATEKHMTRIRLLSAFQVLTVPATRTGVSHKRARQVVQEILELDELPKTNPTPQPTLEAYLLTWLGLELV
jgi:hypothetical protein